MSGHKPRNLQGIASVFSQKFSNTKMHQNERVCEPLWRGENLKPLSAIVFHKNSLSGLAQRPVCRYHYYLTVLPHCKWTAGIFMVLDNLLHCFSKCKFRFCLQCLSSFHNFTPISLNIFSNKYLSLIMSLPAFSRAIKLGLAEELSNSIQESNTGL